MKFTIDVEEFWLDEEELSVALQSHVKKVVVFQILESIKDKVERQITKRVEEIMEEKTIQVIDNTINDFIKTGTILSNKQEVPIIGHLRNVFMNNHGWNNPKAQLQKLAEKFGKEIKLQYNAAFANKIVANMKEQGLLRDDVVQILLEGK